MAIDPDVGTVSRVLLTVERAGKNAGFFHCDLIHVAGVPTVVFSWTPGPNGDIPESTVPLDPAYLEKPQLPGADFLYQWPVTDPRRFD